MPSISGVRWPTARSRSLASWGSAGEAPACRVAVGFMMSLPGCRLNRFDDLDVAGAAAQIARQGLADFALGGIRVAAQQGFRGHDHPRRAEAALGAELLVEGLLQPAHPAACRQALDRLDALAGAARGQRDAGQPRLAIDQYRAGAALAAVATLLRAGQADGLAQVVDQQGVVGDRILAGAPVHRQ